MEPALLERAGVGSVAVSRPENRLFYPALDGVRALAFLMVFGQHYYGLSWGWTGVDIFFVLSGFLITGILFDTKDTTNRAWNFFIDLMAAALIVMAIHPGSWTYRVFMPQPLRWIGRVSYGAYVLHDIPRPLYGLLFPPHYGLASLFALVCTLVLAGVSFRFVETPFIRMKERWTRRPGQSASLA